MRTCFMEAIPHLWQMEWSSLRVGQIIRKKTCLKWPSLPLSLDLDSYSRICKSEPMPKGCSLSLSFGMVKCTIKPFKISSTRRGPKTNAVFWLSMGDTLKKQCSVEAHQFTHQWTSKMNEPSLTALFWLCYPQSPAQYHPGSTPNRCSRLLNAPFEGMQGGP